MTAEPRKPAPQGVIEAFKIHTQPVGKLPVIAASLATGGLPAEAFRTRPAPTAATKPPPSRR